MTLRERFGCFLLIVGTAVFAVFAVPLWNSLVGVAGKAPAGWLWVALGAALAAWAGWRLLRSGRRGVEDERPPSLARSLYNRMRAGRDKKDKPAP
jgi:hypothetical protein